MAAPNSKRQKAGWSKLDAIFADAVNVWVIYYSCESFYDRPNGTSPRITSIAVYDSLERKMLDAFYGHVGSYRGTRYLHWNMRDINYGFAAIEHRYRVLGGNPIIIEDERKTALARLLVDIYGVRYIGHPRLETLLAKNSIKPLDFLSGKQEAQAFENRNFVGLHQSTLRKVHVIANIAERAHSRQLKTNTTWWEMHGGRSKSILNWVMENKVVAFTASVASIAGLVLTIYALR